jgi:hypothetical protein
VGHPLGPELGDEDLDPHLLMWDVHRNIDLDAVPPGRTVLRFSFRDVPAPGRDWWLVITRRAVPRWLKLSAFAPVPRPA